MHSLKGASGFLGLNKINGLAHKAENILDELRQGSMRVTGAIMDLTSPPRTPLRTMVDNLENSGVRKGTSIPPRSSPRLSWPWPGSFPATARPWSLWPPREPNLPPNPLPSRNP